MIPLVKYLPIHVAFLKDSRHMETTSSYVTAPLRNKVTNLRFQITNSMNEWLLYYSPYHVTGVDFA